MRGVTKGEKFYNGNICLEEDCGGFWLRVEDEETDDMFPQGIPLTADELPRIKEVIEQWQKRNENLCRDSNIQT